MVHDTTCASFIFAAAANMEGSKKRKLNVVSLDVKIASIKKWLSRAKGFEHGLDLIIGSIGKNHSADTKLNWTTKNTLLYNLSCF